MLLVHNMNVLFTRLSFLFFRCLPRFQNSCFMCATGMPGPYLADVCMQLECLDHILHCFLYATGMPDHIWQMYVCSWNALTISCIAFCMQQECLTIFGSGSGPAGSVTSMKMCYAGYGQPLVVMLEEEGVLTDCSLKTLEPDEVLDFDFCSTNVINKIIMKVSFWCLQSRDTDLLQEQRLFFFLSSS